MSFAPFEIEKKTSRLEYPGRPTAGVTLRMIYTAKYPAASCVARLGERMGRLESISWDPFESMVKTSQQKES